VFVEIVVVEGIGFFNASYVEESHQPWRQDWGAISKILVVEKAWVL
jgi:hypothetical protein